MMKNLILNRFISMLLCLILALGLTACDFKNMKPVKEGKNGTAKEKEMNSEQAEASLTLLRDSMKYSDQIAGAVAYIGYREQNESMPLEDWMKKNCSELTEEMPFLLEIPEERILGAGYGDLYCIVPKDENTGLAVNHVKWKSLGHSAWPVSDELLYLEEYAKPVLVFVNFKEFREEPDTEITLVTKDDLEVKWCPLINEYGCPILPTGNDYIPLMIDFGFFGSVTGLDYPENWEPEGNDWWIPPTDWELAYTSWYCEHWTMDISWGDSDIEYSGIINLYYQAEEGQEYELAYSGVWRMEEDCLRLEISDNMGNSVNGSFPVLMDPSGEILHIQQDRETYICPPFFGDDITSMELMRIYG